MSLITLTTDFGMRDPDLGFLKSRILKAIPGAQLIDISHNAMPFDFEEAVYIIRNALKDFPPKTIHLIGYESETISKQPALLSYINDQFYLSNNNKIVATAFADKNARHYVLKQTANNRFLQPHINAAKLILKGEKLDEFAMEIENPPVLNLQKPTVQIDPVTGKAKLIITKVIYNDHYGNAVFNLTKDDFDKYHEGRHFKIKFGRNEIDRLVDHYKMQSNENEILTMDGKMFARFNDFGYLEIFLYKSNAVTGGADTLLGLQKNSTVHIVFDI
jgi:S-adenosylmethionine hydrolase